MKKIEEQELKIAREIIGRLSTLEAIYRETEESLNNFRQQLNEKYGEINVDLVTGEYEEISEEETKEE